MFLVDGFLKAKSYYHTLLLRRLLHGTTTWQSRKLTLQGICLVAAGGEGCAREKEVWVCGPPGGVAKEPALLACQPR